MSNDAPSGKIPITLDDPETRRVWERAQVTKRETEQWPSWKRLKDEEARGEELRAFHARWRAFMEGGWEHVLRTSPEAVEAARRRALALMPQHPASIAISEIVARVVDIEKLATQEELFAALLFSERHGHAHLVAGRAFQDRRVPRRGHALEDMYYLLGYAPALEPPDDGG